MQDRDRVFGLDIVRAVAALSVVCTHIIAMMPPGSGWMHPLIFNGFFGVELFFVLSGFLIGGILLRESESGRLFRPGGLAAFWRRRWYRTLPNYFLFFGLLTLRYWWVLDWSWFDWRVYARYPLFLQNLLWPMPEFYAVSWSLSVEEWFYFLLPLLAVILARMIGKKHALRNAGIVLFLASLLLSVRQPWQAGWDGYDKLWRKVAWLRLNAILFGVLLVSLKARLPRAWNALHRARFLLILPILALIELSFGEFRTQSWFYRSWGTEALFLPLYSACCAFVLPLMDSIRRGPRLLVAPITRLSKISYSLYLCHVPLLYSCRSFLPASGWPLFFAGLAISLVAAEIVYRFWESPWLRMRDRIPARVAVA